MSGSAALGCDAVAGLERVAKAQGLVAVGVVDAFDSRFAASHDALDEFLASEKSGEMAFMVRHGDLRKHPERILPGVQTMVVAAMAYRGEAGPIARYAQWADYHGELYVKMAALADFLANASPGSEQVIAVDTKPVLERSAAELAGIGQIAKNGCLIVPGIGSYVLLGVVLTTLGLEPGTNTARATQAERWQAVCGSCTACLDACPTQAFDGPGRLDPRKCISYLTIEHRGAITDELAAQMGQRIVGCDVCQEVCPHNASPTRERRVPMEGWMPRPAGGEREANLVRLATVGSNQYKKFVRGTPMNRIPRRAMRRNALIALGNDPSPVSPELSEVLTACALDEDPEVARWARWALARRTTGHDLSKG